jgi:hypothetical protein
MYETLHSTRNVEESTSLLIFITIIVDDHCNIVQFFKSESGLKKLNFLQVCRFAEIAVATRNCKMKPRFLNYFPYVLDFLKKMLAKFKRTFSIHKFPCLLAIFLRTSLVSGYSILW